MSGILTDVLGFFKRDKFVETNTPDDVLILGIHEKPDMLGVASPVPYKDIKLIKVKDLVTNGTPTPVTTCSVDTLAELADVDDCNNVYIVAENITYLKSNLLNADVVDDGLNVIHSNTSDYSWVRDSSSTVLNIRDLIEADGKIGTDDTAVFKKAFAACNDRSIYQKVSKNQPNPHLDTVYIPEGDYSIEETIQVRCNVISSPNALVRFDQKSILDSTWRDNRALFKIGNTSSDYAYDTVNYKVDNDPFADETNLHRWIELDSIIRLGPTSMETTTQTVTSCVKIDSSNQDAKDSYQDLRDFLQDKVPGQFKLNSFEINGISNPIVRGGTLETAPMAKTNAPSNLNGRLKILLLDLDPTTNAPISGIIYDRNYWDDSVTIVENSIDADTATYTITLRVTDLLIRQLYQGDNTTELVTANRRAYLYHDNKEFSYLFEPDCVSKEENFHLPEVIAADNIVVDGSNERFIFFDQAGRFNLDESNQESPYLRGKVRTTSEEIVDEIKGYSIELPRVQHQNTTNHWPIYQQYKNVEADYSTAILVNGAKNCYIKCIDARFFSTYMHLMGGSSTVGLKGVIGCTFNGGNCANNKRQIEMLPHRPNAKKVGGYVNSNRFIDFTMNWAANNLMKDGSKQTAHVTADSIISLQDIYADLLPAVQADYTGNERLLCVKFESRYPVLKRLSYFADSNGNSLSAQAIFSISGANTLTLGGEVANLGLVNEVNIYVTDSINTEGLWGQVASFTYDGEDTIINITRDPAGISDLGTDAQFYFYGTFDLERAKPNYYMDLNGVDNALNRISEFRVDHITPLQDGSGDYVIITNYGDGDPIYGDNSGKSQSTWTPENNNPDLYVELRYARLGSHPTHRDPSLPDYIRKDYQLLGMYGTQQVGLGSPSGNGFYNCIFEEHAGLGYKHYDLIGARYSRFIHIRAEVNLNRLPPKEFRNTLYIDGCSKIQFDSGFFMEKSLVNTDTRDLLLPKPSDSIIFDANNKKSFDLRQVDLNEADSTLLKSVYDTTNGTIDIDYADVTYGPNSKVTINKKVFAPKEKKSTVQEEYNRQILNLKYSSEVKLPATSTSFSVDVFNSNYRTIQIIPEAGVTFRGIDSGNPLTTNEFILAGGSARFTNLGNNKYNVSGDLIDVADGLSTTYQTILTNTGTTGDLTDEQKLAQDIFIRTLEATSIWNKIIKLGIFGGMPSAAVAPGKEMNLINWKNSGDSTQTINGIFTLQGSPVVQDNSLPVYDADTTQDFGFEYVTTGGTDGTISYNETIPSTSFTGLMKYTAPPAPYTGVVQRIQLSTNAPELTVDYLDSGKLYKVQMEIYIPSTNDVASGGINGVRLLTNGADPVVTFHPITLDTWTQIEYVMDSAGGALGNAFQIRFIGNNGNPITDPNNPPEEAYFRDFSIIPLLQTTNQNNPWTEEYGFSANKSGAINTHADSLSTDNITIFAYQSLPAERAAAVIQNAAGIDLYADLNEFEQTGIVTYLDPEGLDGEIANSGFGVGSIIYFNDDTQNDKFGVVASVLSKDTDGTKILIEDILAVPAEGEITWRTIEPRSNQVQFGITGTKQKYLKLYADTRTNDINLFNDRIKDDEDELVYFDTTKAQSMALTRQSGNITDLELFRNGVTTTIDAPIDPLAINLTDLLIFQSNQDIANDFAMGGFIIAEAMTNEELTILQELFETYYS